jgi:hypothetical protein
VQRLLPPRIRSCRVSIIQEFFGIGLDIASSDLDWHMHEVPGLLPDRLLPIACDSGGNLFCLSCSGQDAGHVIYVDLTTQTPQNT